MNASSYLPAAAKAAVVTIKIDGEVIDVLTSDLPADQRCTKATMELAFDAGCTRSVGGTDSRSFYLVVYAATYIDLLFVDPTIRPIGVAFKYKGKKKWISQTGDIVMPADAISFLPASYVSPKEIRGQAIRYLNNHELSGDEGEVVWSFYIVFQTTDGKVGIIDPDQGDQP